MKIRKPQTHPNAVLRYNKQVPYYERNENGMRLESLINALLTFIVMNYKPSPFVKFIESDYLWVYGVFPKQLK